MAGTKIETFIQERSGKQSEVVAAFKDKKTIDQIAELLPKGSPPILDITDWSQVKGAYDTKPFEMLCMIVHRKQVVDGKIAELSSGSKIVAKSVGSTDLTSDYDITVGIPGGDVSGAELELIQKFNDYVRTTYGKQSGTIFDTNLYAKDFLPLNDKDSRLSLPEVGKAMYNMMIEGQDIGALIKLRRYMTNSEWIDFSNAVINQSGAAGAITRNRFESADGQYLLNVKYLLDEFQRRANAEKAAKANPAVFLDAQNKVNAAMAKCVLTPAEQSYVAASAHKEMAQAQLLLRYNLLQWEHDYPDLTLWVSNDLYIKDMRQIRAYQQKLGPNGNPAAGDVRVADLISSAIFFASEAYLSEGALRHVVDGVQVAKADPSLKGEALTKAINAVLMQLTIDQLLQSINEQFGDFLKDYAHYGDTPTFLFRGAKYVQRLFEAVSFLAAKKTGGSAAEVSALSALDMASIDHLFAKPSQEILARLNCETAGLVAVRKNKVSFDTPSGRDPYCIHEAKTYLGVETGKAMKELITKMVLLLNAQVRSKLSTAPSVDEVRSYFSKLSLS